MRGYFDADEEASEVAAPRGMQTQVRPKHSLDQNDTDGNSNNPTESLNQTLMRFQSMIKQVE